MENKLTCTATDCVHNLNGLCSAKRIHVGGITAASHSDTQCDTFSPKGVKNAFYNLGNMNVTGEIKQLFNRDSVEMSPEIKCSAEKCKHNSNKTCNAVNLSIDGYGAKESDGTKCSTFEI